MGDTHLCNIFCKYLQILLQSVGPSRCCGRSSIFLCGTTSPAVVRQRLTETIFKNRKGAEQNMIYWDIIWYDTWYTMLKIIFLGGMASLRQRLTETIFKIEKGAEHEGASVKYVFLFFSRPAAKKPHNTRNQLWPRRPFCCFERFTLYVQI